MATSIGTLAIKIVADLKGLTGGLSAASAKIGAFATSVTKAGAAAGIAFAGLGAAFAVKAVLDTINELDQFSKALDKTGASAEGLSGLKLLGEFEDVEFEEVVQGLTLMNRKLGEAISGSKEAGVAFGRLGLDASELAAKPAEMAFADIAEKISALESPALRVAATMDIFGKSGAKLAPLFKDGAAGIAKATEEAKRLGLAVSEFDLQQIAKADDALDNFSAILKGIKQRIILEVLPAVNAFFKPFLDTAATVNWGEATVQALEKVLKVLAQVADQFVAVKRGAMAMAGMWGELKQDAQADPYTFADKVDRFFKVREMEKKSQAQPFLKGALLGGFFGGATFGAKGGYLGQRTDVDMSGMSKGSKADADAMVALYGEAQKLLESLSGPWDKYNDQIQEANRFLKEGLIDFNQYADALQKFEKDLVSALGVDISTPLSKWQEQADKLGKLYEEGFIGANRWAEMMDKNSKDMLSGLGISIKESPLETFKKQLKGLDEALDEGVLSWEMYQAGLDSALEGVGAFDMPEIKAPEAALFGSKEALSAINRFNREGSQDPIDRVRQALEQQKRGDDQRKKLLEDIKRQLDFDLI